MDEIRVRVILDVVHEYAEGDVLTEDAVSIGVGDERTGNLRIVGRENAEDGAVQADGVALRAGRGEDFGVEARRDRVHRVAAGHAKADRHVVGDGVEEVDAGGEVAGRQIEVAAAEERTRVGNRVRFERDAGLKPLLQSGVGVVGLVGHEADGRSAVFDFAKAFEDRVEVFLEAVDFAQIVEGQDDDGLDTAIADPHRRGQLGKVFVGIVDERRLQVEKLIGLVDRAIGLAGGEARSAERNGGRQCE